MFNKLKKYNQRDEWDENFKEELQEIYRKQQILIDANFISIENETSDNINQTFNFYVQRLMNREIKIIVQKPELEKRDKNKIKELDISSVSSEYQSISSDHKLKQDSQNYSMVQSMNELPKYEK